MVAPTGMETDEALTFWLKKARDVAQTIPPKRKGPAMTIPEALLDVRTHTDAGYRPVVDFGAWRVAILNFSDDLRPENITTMQRHNETDEVFVLLRGRCTLFVGEGDDHSITVDPCAVHGTPHDL